MVNAHLFRLPIYPTFAFPSRSHSHCNASTRSRYIPHTLHRLGERGPELSRSYTLPIILFEHRRFCLAQQNRKLQINAHQSLSTYLPTFLYTMSGPIDAVAMPSFNSLALMSYNSLSIVVFRSSIASSAAGLGGCGWTGRTDGSGGFTLRICNWRFCFSRCS